MAGLVAFASQIGLIFAVLLPVCCYLGSGILFLNAAWGFWQWFQPHNPNAGRPWAPIVSLLMAGVLASFDRILTMANVTGGSSVVVSLAPLGYAPPGPSTTVLGATPATSIVNVVTMFQLFFQAFGAIACLFAVLSWRSSVVGRSNRPQGHALVQFVFGILLINVVTVATWVTGLFA